MPPRRPVAEAKAKVACVVWASSDILLLLDAVCIALHCFSCHSSRRALLLCGRFYERDDRLRRESGTLFGC